ncbi:MAG: hypothetical protein CMLOHMNK_02131 [Steroidobacteraceae bacterium]|nr:hypothetical protein [Steroidobacteraceae bacterium]
MARPAALDGYRDECTLECERALLTLLRGLGLWKDSVHLVGGLTPRYLVPARPPVVPARAGTLDVDIVTAIRALTCLRDPYDAIMDQHLDLGLQDDIALIRLAARSLASARSVRSTP